MIVDLALPDLGAVHRVHGIGAAENITEVETLGCSVGDDCSPNLSRDPLAPAQAAAGEIERIKRSVMTADEDSAPADGRL